MTAMALALMGHCPFRSPRGRPSSVTKAVAKSLLVLAAFQKFLDTADILKEADDQWRANNPAKAAQIPFDALGPELGDVLAPYLKDSRALVERRSWCAMMPKFLLPKPLLTGMLCSAM